MGYFVYILKSKVAQKTYVGYTINLDRRLLAHNRGQSSFTSKYKPWILLYFESLESKQEAIQREKYFKSRSGRRWIKKMFFK